MEYRIVKAFKALGEPSRLKIIKILSIQSMCVCELCEVLKMLQPRVSQHLKILKEANIVNESKEGNFVYYSLNRDSLESLWQDFMSFLNKDLKELAGYKEEYVRYLNLENNEVVKNKKKILRNS